MIEGGLQTAGAACCQFIGYSFSFVKDQAQWRGSVGIQLLPAAIVSIFINFPPKSPRWLIKHGMLKEGTYNLTQLHGLHENDPTLLAERDAIVASFEAQAGEGPFSYRESRKTKTFHLVAIGFSIQAAQQLSGINMVSTYANKILADPFNLAPGLSHLIAAYGGAEYTLCSLLSVLLIEGLGRRCAFMWTASGMAICFAIIAGLSSSGNHTQQFVAAGFLFLFNTFFGLAWVGGPFLYLAKIAPLRCRAQVNATTSAGGWIFCFVVVMAIPPAMANLGRKTYM
jgi:hypothetical protein